MTLKGHDLCIFVCAMFEGKLRFYIINCCLLVVCGKLGLVFYMCLVVSVVCTCRDYGTGHDLSRSCTSFDR